MASSQIPAALLLAALALSLSGCGSKSDSSDPASADLVSQSVVGTLAGEITVGTMGKVPHNGTMDLYIDADALKVRFDVDTGVLKIPVVGEASARIGLLLDATTKNMTVYELQNMAGKAKAKCVVHNVPMMPPLQALKMQIQLMLHKQKVVAKDGELRKFEQKRSVPVPGQNKTTDVDVVVELDSSNVMQKMGLTMQVTEEGMDMDINEAVAATNATAGKPDARFFQVPSDWGTCEAALDAKTPEDATLAIEGALTAMPPWVVRALFAALVAAPVAEPAALVAVSPAVAEAPAKEIVV